MMEKDRLGAFIDAVLAIIMTILVLELPRPELIKSRKGVCFYSGVLGLVALTETLIPLQFEFCIDYDAEDGGKVLLKRNDVETVCLLTKTGGVQSGSASVV